MKVYCMYRIKQNINKNRVYHERRYIKRDRTILMKSL